MAIGFNQKRCGKKNSQREVLGYIVVVERISMFAEKIEAVFER